MLTQIFLLGQSQGSQSNPLASLLPFILILVIIYFFMIRPQSKKAKEQKLFKTQLQKGDKVITIGGIHGKVAEIRDADLLIEIGDNVKVKVQRDAISMEATRAVYGAQNDSKKE